MREYNDAFYESVNTRASLAAYETARIISFLCEPKTMIDIGSGLCGWSKEFLDRFPSIENVVALDYKKHAGEPLDSLLRNPNFNFVIQDFEKISELPVICCDLAICVEVLEHISETAAQKIMDEFKAKCTLVVFSAAISGQGGTHHINEQNFSYWKSNMLSRGFYPLDVLRPQFNMNQEIPSYYKNNVVLWVNSELAQFSDLHLNHFNLLSNFPLDPKDTRSWILKLRFKILKSIPPSVVTLLAKIMSLIRYK